MGHCKEIHAVEFSLCSKRAIIRGRMKEIILLDLRRVDNAATTSFANGISMI